MVFQAKNDHQTSKQVWSLQTIKQKPFLVEDKRNMNTRKRKGMLCSELQLTTIRIWQKVEKNNNQTYLFQLEKKQKRGREGNIHQGIDSAVPNLSPL